MRKLIESTLVSLDGVIEAPERWATFDAEAHIAVLEVGVDRGHGDTGTAGNGAHGDRLLAILRDEPGGHRDDLLP